jgi:hypothetical protein
MDAGGTAIKREVLDFSKVSIDSDFYFTWSEGEPERVWKPASK